MKMRSKIIIAAVVLLMTGILYYGLRSSCVDPDYAFESGNNYCKWV